VRSIFPFLLLSVCAAPVAAEPAPLLVIIERRFGMTAPGPTLVVYDDGMVVFQSPDVPLKYAGLMDIIPDRSYCMRYFTAHLERPRDLMDRLFPYRVRTLQKHHYVSRSIDLPLTYIWSEGHVVRIYGDWRRRLQGEEAEPEPIPPLPAGLDQTLRLVAELDFPGRTAWLPHSVEVSLYSSSPGSSDSLPWPAEFPGLSHIKRTSTIDDRIMADIELPGHQLGKLCELITARPERASFRIDGRTMIVTSILFRFPQQETWERDIRVFIENNPLR